MPQASCRWLNQLEALRIFATYSGATQSQEHIKPLHWYVASRLVVEGGFRPEEITPRPPFRVNVSGKRAFLVHDPEVAGGGEATILGGLKTKSVDVVVAKPGLGPVLAVSCKGMTGALRNLTNRMEETIGECTNLHITYPALVFGYMFAVRANQHVEQIISDSEVQGAPASRQLADNDIVLGLGGEPVEAITRFAYALRELSGRRGIRDDVSRYEAVSLLLVEMADAVAGSLVAGYPPPGSPLRLDEFFSTLFLRYDERYVYSAPDLKRITRRLEWDPASPAFSDGLSKGLEYLPRLSG